MPKEEQIYNSSITSVNGTRLDLDSDPLYQPKGTHRFALNAVNESKDGKHGSLSNERANYIVTQRPLGYEVVGNRYVGDDANVYLMVNPVTGGDMIGIVEKNNVYRTLVDTSVIGFDIAHQCDVEFRIRNGKERVIYWVDGNDYPKVFNLDKPYDFYNTAYQTYLRNGGNPDTYSGEKWDGSSFNLQKTYTEIPVFQDISVIETGAALSGSYNFSIQLVDEDLNPTAWLTTSNTVNIFNDSTSAAYYKIRGSKNITSDAQSFPRTNKSIRLTITSLDTNFPYYRIAIIRAAGLTGQPDKVLLSDIMSTSDGNFTYSGDDGNLAEGSLDEILIDDEIIFAPDHIEQLENRLILSNTKGKDVDFCAFQSFASRISSDIVYKDTLLNTVDSDPNIKNARSTFFFRGYMPGEVYSFAIVYIFSDKSLSPAFHIPGKGPQNTSSSMKLFQLSNNYLNVHNCSTNNYWDKDMDGKTLVGTQIRHHRFPFRSEVSKPLYTTNTGTTNITKYRLKANIILNPAWTPGPIAYPVDGSGDDIVISYGFNYQITGNPTNNSYVGELTSVGLGQDILIYDDTVDLSNAVLTNYGQLDSTSELATYQTGGNTRFLITFTHDSYVSSSSINTDTSQIFGINFGNIQKPTSDVIGFYIVRNERLEDDKLILDNAIFGPMTTYQQYKSFATIMPKQFYHVDTPTCGNPADSGKTLLYYNKGVWFWNPEFQFNTKKAQYTSIHVEGVYDEASVNMPTISNLDGSRCNGYTTPTGALNGSEGVYIEDVQAGTTYNPAVDKAKDKDDDGFDLIIGYRNTNIVFNPTTDFTFPVSSSIQYLSAASYKNIDADIMYNTSVDNKIGMHLMTDTIDTTNFFDSSNKNHLMYGSLVKESTSNYSNFITRDYFKEHNNPILFGSNTIVNGVQIFNGDAVISSFNFVNSLFYDIVAASRAKKSSLWKIIVGAILVVAGVVLAIFTAGAGLAVSAAGEAVLAGLAISYGVSLAVSGIKFDQMKSMIDVDYQLGLKDTVVDGGVFECVRDTVGLSDDTIRWFCDRVSNIYIESSVPFGLRAGLTSGVTDFMDAPAQYDENAFRTYLTEKLTVLDQSQGSGRLYKGYAGAEFYDVNPDYNRFNKEKVFVHLPIEYDCCNDSNTVFPLRSWYSEQSFQEENTDNYRVFLPNNYKDIEGIHGEITDLYRLGNSLFIHTKEGLWHLPQNLQERTTNEIVSFIGTGDFFGIPTREVIDDSIGSGGTQHKWGTVKTKNGIIFISEVEGTVYLHSDRIRQLSDIGLRNWFKENLKSYLVKQLFDKFGLQYPYDNNPANISGVGYVSTYDTRYERILVTKRDYSILSDKLAGLVVAASKPLAGAQFTYAIDDGKFYAGTIEILLTNPLYFENKSWTLSYSFHTNGWISWHSYLPNYYIYNQNSFYSIIYGDNNIYRHNGDSKFHTFYGIFYPFIIEYVRSESIQTSIFEFFIINTIARSYDVTSRQFNDERFITFNKLLIYNSYQSSGELIMKVKDTQGLPSSWYNQQLTNSPGTILITRKDKDWSVNDLRDYVIDYSKPLFTTNWSVLAPNYYIDKVPNPGIISYTKPWYELQNFRDKYLVIRLKFDTFDNVNLIMNYSVETEQTSDR